MELIPNDVRHSFINDPDFSETIARTSNMNNATKAKAFDKIVKDNYTKSKAMEYLGEVIYEQAEIIDAREADIAKMKKYIEDQEKNSTVDEDKISSFLSPTTVVLTDDKNKKLQRIREVIQNRENQLRALENGK